MYAILYTLLYISGIIGFISWDAYIGFRVELEKNFHDGPNAAFLSLFWPLSFPVLMFMGFTKKLAVVRDEREAKLNQKLRLRVAAQKQEEAIVKQLEQELEAEIRTEYKAERMQRGVKRG